MTQTAAHRIADEICDAILRGEFAPGRRLDEQGLARRFGLSRTPVREALVEVCARGLAVRRPSRGVEVVAPDLALVRSRFEALAELEALCAGLAAHRIGIDGALGLQGCLARMAAVLDDPAAYAALNVELHDRIGAEMRNDELQAVLADFRTRLAPMRRAQFVQPARLQASHAEHCRLVEAICDRRADEATALMRRHIIAASAHLLA